jgi:hypothetical protein
MRSHGSQLVWFRAGLVKLQAALESVTRVRYCVGRADVPALLDLLTENARLTSHRCPRVVGRTTVREAVAAGPGRGERPAFACYQQRVLD